MTATVENVLFLQALAAQVGRLESLVGEEWPYVREQLLGLQHRLGEHDDEAAVSDEIDALIELLLDTPAADFVRSLLGQALSGADIEASTTRAVREAEPVAAAVPAADLATASRALASHLTPRGGIECTVVPILYATDRERRRQGFYGPRRGTLEFGIAKVSIPNTHSVGALETPRWWKLERRGDPSAHVMLVSVSARDRGAFVADLKAALAGSASSVLLFVHGYNVTFADAARRTAQLAYDLAYPGVPLLYSWPSVGRALWYLEDETNVEWTVPHLAEVLEVVRSQVGARSVDAVAHSMGNRALVRALEALGRTPPPPGAARLRHIVLAAPDIDADVFRGLAAAMAGPAGRMTLYASSRDRALWWSRRFHGYPRAGESGEGRLVLSPALDTIDATAVDTSLLGHSYYGGSRSILADLSVLIAHGSPPPRFGMTRAELAGAPYWRFRP